MKNAMTFPPMTFDAYDAGGPIATLTDNVKIHEAQLHPEMARLIVTDKAKLDAQPFVGRTCSWHLNLRCSKKQLWFFAYRSKELTGHAFTCEDAAGHRDHPTGFVVGKWADGSLIWAECTRQLVNGPYWLAFTFRMALA